MGTPTVERVAYRPDSSLAAMVDRFLGFARAGGLPGVHQVRASLHVKLIVALAEPFEYTTMADAGQPPGSYRAFLAGPHARPAGVRHDGGHTAVEVEIQPMWAAAL